MNIILQTGNKILNSCPFNDHHPCHELWDAGDHIKYSRWSCKSDIIIIIHTREGWNKFVLLMLIPAFCYILRFWICTVDNQYFSSSNRPCRSCISLFLQLHPLARTPFMNFLYLQFPHYVGSLCGRVSLDTERSLSLKCIVNSPTFLKLLSPPRIYLAN